MTERVWLGDTIRVSNSELQTFKDCRRRWWFSYYRELGLKMENREVTGPRSLGTRVHVAMEALYTQDESPLGVLAEIYDLERQRLTEAGLLAKVTDLNKEYDLAYIMVSGYIDWAQENGIDDGLELVAAEEVVEVDSHIPGIKLRGKMDQRVIRKSDGARLFRDFKTVGDLATPPKILPLDEQMKFYHMLEYLHSIQVSGSEPQWRTDGALYTMLRKVKRTATAKPPFYDQLEVHHNLTEIRSMYARVAKVVEEIYDARIELDKGGDPLYLVPPRPSRDCTWKCDFFAVCAMVDDGSDVEGMLDAYYEHLDPHARYDVEDTKGEGA